MVIWVGTGKSLSIPTAAQLVPIDTSPFSQILHFVDWLVSEYSLLFRSHEVQLEELVLAANLPISQLWQAVEPRELV